MDWIQPNGKRFEDWEEADLQYFIDEKIPEGTTLDYKRDLQLATDSDKLELISDIVSFANTSGGYLIFGIGEGKDKSPSDLCGIEILSTPDELIARINNIIRDTVEPRISNISIRSISLASGKFALIIKIPNSLFSPHRSTKTRHFYARNSTGKFPLDISQIRNSFLQAETLRTASQNFRLDRLSQIMDYEFSEIPSNSKVVVHIIPQTSLKPNFAVDLSELVMASGARDFPGMGEPRLFAKYTYDGIYGDNSSKKTYSKLLDQAIFESVSVSYFYREDNGLPSKSLEEDIIDFVKNAINFLVQKINVDMPIIISISFLNIKGKKLFLPSGRFWDSETPPLQTNNLLLPELLFSDSSLLPLSFEETAKFLYPVITKWWNAFEWASSPYFDNEKNWKG